MKRYDFHTPFRSKILKKIHLNKGSQNKKVYHFVLDISDSNIIYNVGDSAAILPENDPNIVEKCIALLDVKTDFLIEDKRTNKKNNIFSFLQKKANISKVSAAVLRLISHNHKNEKKKKVIDDLLKNKEEMKKYLLKYDLSEILQENIEANITANELCSKLTRLIPRYYSVSSSQAMYRDQIHLTVSEVAYSLDGKLKRGVTTNFLCNLAKENKTPIYLYMQANSNFTLPEDSNAPIIMIGPGVGIAPFVGFLQQRYLEKQKGKNWLFFGQCYEKTDFLYEDFFRKLENENKLVLTTAFSRDQKMRVYVQHRMQENAKELFNWLKNGAYLYICGDATRMAKDVDLTLLNIIKEQKNISEEEASLYIKNLRSQGRYLRDIY
jgi:sulfite reductase (NADPH) flavoprotein alpha-component